MLFVLTRLIPVSHYSQVTFAEYSCCQVSDKSYHSDEGQEDGERSPLTRGDSTPVLQRQVETPSESNAPGAE